MKSLIRVGAVLAAVAFCVPALACSEMMQQTTADNTQQQPAVATAQPAPAKQVQKSARAQPKQSKATRVAKAPAQKVAAAN